MIKKSDEPDIKERLDLLKERMDHALDEASRDQGSLTLVAVSKRQPLYAILKAYKLGIRHFGESQIQEATPKIKAAPDGITWHFIGHLQKNKVRKAVKLFQLIHSVDSLSLLQRVNDVAGQERVCPEVLLQVNLALDPDKHGLHPEAVRQVLQDALSMKNVRCTGLMGIPPLGADEAAARAYFKEMNALASRLRDISPQWPGKLSMGMTGDYEVAIHEGSNFIRVGSYLFGKRVA